MPDKAAAQSAIDLYDLHRVPEVTAPTTSVAASVSTDFYRSVGDGSADDSSFRPFG